MELMVLVGVWALAFGHISLGTTGKKGNQARIFGLLTILAAAYGLPHLNGFLAPYVPKAITGNEAFHSAYNLLVGAVGIYITNFVMTAVYPKLRVPTVSVSIKSKRAA